MSRLSNPRFLLRCCLVSVALVFVGGSVPIYQFLWPGTPELYESHVAPSKPIIEIRWTYGGFFGGGSAFDAHLVEGWRKKKILTLLENNASHFDYTSNSTPRTYATCIVTPGRLQIYQVAWSTDSNRVAIAFHGYFVAAYDRVTGKRIEVKDYLDSKVASWHDYKRCDSEIERFLQGETRGRALQSKARQLTSAVPHLGSGIMGA